MCLDAVAPESAHREVIDADGSYATLSKEMGGLLRDVYEILDEGVASPAALRVSRLEQESLATPYSVRVKFLRFDRCAIVDLDYSLEPNRWVIWPLDHPAPQRY